MIGLRRGLNKTIDPNLKLELKFNWQTYTDLAGTVAARANDYVRAWKSSVGGHLFTQATDAARPQRQSDGLYFDGGDLVSANMVEDWNWGTGNFTVEFWANARPYISISTASITAGMSFETDNLLMAHANGSWGFSVPTGATPTAWSHYAAVRNSGTVRVYRDGVQISTVAYSGAMLFSASYPFTIGVRNAVYTTGKLTDIRIYDIAKYTANFTPPTRSA